MRGPLGIAVVGLGRIAESHLDGIAQCPDLARLAAVVDRKPEHAAAVGARLEVPGFATLEEALALPEVEAVVICLPNHLHLDAVLLAASRGRHVLCEKPLATTPAEGERAVEACERSGVRLMAAQSRRFIPALREARRRRDEIGRPLHVLYTLTRHYDLRSARSWHRSLRSTGGLVISLLGAMSVDFSLWFLEGREPVSVFASATAFNPDLEGPNECSLVIRFDDGALATNVLSMNAHQQRHEGYLIGSAGTMFFSHGDSDVYTGIRRPSTDLWINGTAVARDGPEANFVHQMREFASAVLEDREPEPSGRAVLTQLRVLEAAKVSALRGRPVTLAGFHDEAYPAR